MKQHRKMNKHHNRLRRRMDCQMTRYELYAEADTNSKILINLRELSRMQRILSVDSSSQKRILMLLEDAGGTVLQRELTLSLNIKPGSASEILSKLEAAGYIERNRNEADRRAVDVTLTESGKEAALEAIEEQDEMLDQNFSNLTDTEKTDLLSLLEKVNADWSTRCLEIEEDRFEARRERQRARRHASGTGERRQRRRDGGGRGNGRGLENGQSRGNGQGRGNGKGPGNGQGRGNGRGRGDGQGGGNGQGRGNGKGRGIHNQ